MGYLIALFAFLARLVKPSQGVHANGFGRIRELTFEARRRRSSRVRRYAVNPPTVVQHSNPREVPVSIPAPRKPVDDELPRTLCPVPADYVPIVNPCAIPPQTAMVRPAYRRWEHAQELARIDRDRLALGVLLDIASRANRDSDGVAK